MTGVRKQPARWKRVTERGRFEPDMYRLTRGGLILATAQQTRAGLWFWYSFGANTADQPTDFESAKRAAAAYVAQCEREGQQG